MRKVLLILLAAAFLCFTVLAVYVESDRFSDRLRPYIAGPLQQILGAEARIGKVKATLLPLVIEVRDVAVPSQRSAEALAVRKVRVYINPVPLLWKKISLSSITVLEPRIDGTRDGSGALDVAAVVDAIRARIESRRPSAPSAWSVSMRTITVRNGRTKLRDLASGTVVNVGGVNARAIFRYFASTGIARISSGTVRVTSPSYPAYDAQLRATSSFKGSALALSAVELRSRSTRISVSGRIVADGDGEIDLKVHANLTSGWWGAVSGILGRQKREPALEAAAAITGTLHSPRVSGSAVLTAIPMKGFAVRKARVDYVYADNVITLQGKDWEFEREGRKLVAGPAAVEAAYEAGTLRLIRTSLVAADWEITASGSINGERGYDVSLSAASSGTGEVVQFLVGLRSGGAVSLSGTLSGPLRNPVFGGTVSAGPLTVREGMVQSVNGVVRYAEKTLSLTGTTIRQEDSRYLLDGSVSFAHGEPYYDARLSVIRSDVVSIVRIFYKTIPLELSASGEILFSGTIRSFRGSGHLDLDAGAAYGESFEKGSLDVELTSGKIVFRRLYLEKGGGNLQGKGWIEFHGGYYGQIKGENVDLSSVDHLRSLAPQGAVELDIRSSGSFSEPQVQAHARSSAVLLHGIPVGTAAADLTIRSGELRMNASISGERERKAALEAAMDLSRPYAWSATSTITTEDEDLSTWVPDSDILSRIRISAEARISMAGELGSSASISGSIVLPRLEAQLDDHRVENEGDAVLQVSRGRLTVRRLVLTGTGTRMAVAGGMHPGKDIDVALDGEVNLSLFRLLYREVEHGDGTASVHLALRDDWSHPSIDGRIIVRDGMLKIRDVPQKFTGLQGTVVFDRERISTDGLAADVGGGRVRVLGSAQLKDSALVDFSVRTTVEGVTVRYPPGLTATLAGTLYYDGNRKAQTLAGEITLQQARYEKRIEWKSMLVDITRGITRKQKTDVGWIGETRLNIRFTGSENVLFESNLARIPLKIDILFQGTVNQVQLLGRVEAREGELYFRNNVFKVIYASADFVDPGRINPVLDVQTETRVRDYRIRLAVSGNADRAVVTFLSDPPLSDSDILALLALGRKGEELRGQEENVGVSESFSFATGKFQDLLESRARSLTGLDRFQVDPYINKSDTPVPRVTVGKEVVERKLFMTYSSNIGGTTPEQNLRLEYILNRNISLLGEYDELGQIGADLKFRFEFR